MGFEFSDVWEKGIIALLGEKYTLNVAVLITGYFLCCAVSYLLGSLNFGLLISKYRFGDDIRSHGSGNAGMTNMLRTYGKSAAAFTLLGDMLKAVISVLIVGRLLGGFYGAYFAGLGCIIGHVYPVFFKFKGGKGVAVAAAMVLCLEPLVFLILFALFAMIVGFTKYLSLGSVVCMMVFPLVLYRFTGPDIHIIIAAIIAVFVIWLHRGNIKRMRAGTENKFSLKSKKLKTEPSAIEKKEQEK